jgi:hypothetical protein
VKMAAQAHMTAKNSTGEPDPAPFKILG